MKEKKDIFLKYAHLVKDATTPWGLSKNTCEMDHQNVWPSYKLKAIKQHPNGLVIIAYLDGEEHVSISQHEMTSYSVPFWLTVEMSHLPSSRRTEVLKAAWALPDAIFQTMEPDITLEEIHNFQELVKS